MQAQATERVGGLGHSSTGHKEGWGSKHRLQRGLGVYGMQAQAAKRVGGLSTGHREGWGSTACKHRPQRGLGV